MKDFIAVVDSGVGGITTLSQILNRVKGYDFVYFGDRDYAPYGNKPEKIIIERLSYITGKFFELGAKAIVIACNTATNVCIDYLRNKNRGIIVGTEPAVKITASLSGKTAVLVTPLTSSQNKFIKLIEGYGKNADVISLNDMAALIENNILDLSRVRKEIEERLIFLKNYNNVVLGCTHYVFLRPYIYNKYPHIKVLDGNEGVARRLESILPPQPVKTLGAIKFMKII